jgi:hypothetical protein
VTKTGKLTSNDILLSITSRNHICNGKYNKEELYS